MQYLDEIVLRPPFLRVPMKDIKGPLRGLFGRKSDQKYTHPRGCGTHYDLAASYTHVLIRIVHDRAYCL